ncbi:uncharacterized protein PEZ65_022552 [Lycodopsis pacificus]
MEKGQNFHRRRIKTSCRFLIKRIKSCVYSNKYELFYQERKEETPHSSAELTGTRQLRGAFSDTEDFLDHGLVSANRCSSRTSSISSWTENIKPSFTEKLKFQSVLEGEPVEIKCKLVACPPPTILWFHNNKSIPQERRRRISTDSRMHLHTTSLVMDSIKEKDSGSYKVMALNTEGSAESTASLLVSLKEEQSANYLGFVRRSAKAHESVDTMAEQRKERKFRVDLRCVGSPFDKMSKVHQGRSRSKSSLVRTVYFKSGSHAKDKEVEKESKRLETASERAPSPPPMFDRSERFNDRFSDIYCDRRTGGRFSDKFSDRCSDRYSERFSDTESLHSEVRTKLTTLQKAVKQKKRLSISTMSSSEFESESVASESSYADYVERLRVKPASLPDVQQFNRTFDLEENPGEFQGKSSKRDPSRRRMRHSFEPQSRSRAIQIMRGELVDTLLPETERKSGEKYSEALEDQKVDSFVESRVDTRFKHMVSDRHSVVADQTGEATKVEVQLRHPEVQYSETLAYLKTTTYTESRESVAVVPSEEEVSTRPKPVTSIREKFLSEAVTTEDKATPEPADPDEEEGEGESLRAQYEKSLDAERMQCEEKLLALRIRKWQHGSRMSEEETFPPQTDLPMPTETQYMETAGHIYPQQEVMEKTATVETEAVPESFRKSPRMKPRLVDPEWVNVSTPESPKVKDRGEEVEVSASLLTTSAMMEARSGEIKGEAALMPAQKSPRVKARAAKVEAELSLRTIEARVEERLKESPRPRQVKSNKERFLSEALTPEPADPDEEEGAGESLRAQYETSLDAERMQCEEKLLALRIRKWQHGMQMSEEEVPYPETDLPRPAETQYMETAGHIYPQQEVMEKTATVETEAVPESFHKSPRMKPRLVDPEWVNVSMPESPKVKDRGEEVEVSASLLTTSATMEARSGEIKGEAALMPAQKSPRVKARAAKVEGELSLRTIEARVEERLKESPRPRQVKSNKERFLSEALTPEPADPDEEEGAGESLRAQYEKSLDAERMQCEEKLLALRIRKWQHGMRMSEEEVPDPETDLPRPAETQYMETAGHIYPQQEVMEKTATVETEAVPESFRKSPRIKPRLVDPEWVNVSRPESPKVKDRGEEVEVSASLLTTSATMEARSGEIKGEAALMPAQKSPRVKARAAKVEGELSLRTIEARVEERLKESPRPRQVKSNKETFLSEALTPEPADPEEGAGESLRAQYEKSLDAERMQCEEKLLALRIRKWQHGMQMSEEEVPHPETDLPRPAETQYMEPEGHIYSQQEVVEKRATVDHGTTSTAKSHKVKDRVEQDKITAPVPKTRMKARPGVELETDKQAPTSRLKSRAAEVEAESSPRTKARAEKMLFEKTREERELQLSRENISELKNESEKFVSEEEALTQRIMKWQENVLLEQEQAVEPESDWVEGYSNIRAETTTEAGTNVADSSALESNPHPEVVRSKKNFTGKTAKEKFLLSETVPAGFQDQQRDNEADQLTEGRETRLQRDSEYFVSEEEALAQRILKWQQDVVEQEEVAELESEWALDNQCKQPGTGLLFESHVPDSEPRRGVISHQTQPSDLPPPHATLAGGALQRKQPLPLQHATGYEPSPPRGSSPTYAGLPQRVSVPTESTYDFKSISAKDRSGREASQIQGYSPTQHASVPVERYGLASSWNESPHKSSREFSSVKSRSPQEDLGGEAERRRTREEFTMTVDKSSSQRFHSELREGRERKEEMETTSESSECRQQKDVGGVRREERSGDSFRSKRGGEMSAESLELRGIKKEERRVREESDLKEGVHQSQESKWMKEGDTGGSRPVFVKEISLVKVKIGEMSEFTCQFQGDPLPTVTWLKDGHPLAHNPDYDTVSKAKTSKLTVFYPTTDHEGTYDCVITNKHGKSVCSGTLEISDKKVSRASGATQKVVIRAEREKGEENQESMVEAELKIYMDSAKATLQVPQAVIHRHRCSDESFSSSPVEIRITAATPLPEMREEISEDQPLVFREKPSDVPSDDGASQTVKHKFTFSFDVAGEAPHVVSELENTSCSEGNTAVLECVITGVPAPKVTWYCDDVCLEIAAGKHGVEVDDKVHRLYISSFTYADAGVYKCIARNKMGEVASISDVSFKGAEPVQFSESGGFTPSRRVMRSPVGLTEDVMKPAVFHKAAITHTEDGVIQSKDNPLSSQALSEAVKAPKARPCISREPPTVLGCGLSASAAVIKVSQIKQAFESDSPVASLTSPSPEEQRKETLFPEEFIPAVAISLDQQERVLEPHTVHAEGGDRLVTVRTANPGSPKAVPCRAEPDFTQTIPASEKSVSSQTPVAPKPVSGTTSQTTSSQEGDRKISVISGDVDEEALLAESHGVIKQFVEEVQDSPHLVRPKTQKAAIVQQMEVSEVEMLREDTVHSFDRTSSFIPFQSEKVPAVKCSVTTSAPVKEAVKPKNISAPLKPERQSATRGSSSVHREADVVGTVLAGEELISIPEPSMDSGVFLSMPDSQADVRDVREVAEDMAADVVEPHSEIKGEDEMIDVHVKSNPKPEVDSRFKALAVPEDAAAEGPQSTVASLQEKGSLDEASAAEAGGPAAVVGSMEEEEVTFGAVYDFYNPPTDWGRPLSPESEMSIEIGSTVSEELTEAAERFYTPGSSTEVSQPIAQSFHTPKSHMSFHTASSDTASGFMTPQDYPFSPVEHKRPSTGDSSERFFSPVQFLTSPGDEGIETTPPGINVDDNPYLTKGIGSLGLATLQEKVQGIPPAFLKPLIKKRVFENDSLTFYAEVFGLPSPEVKWFCNKTQLVADDRLKMERDGDSISLTINNVRKADQGEYICEAVNYVGEARSVALVVVVSQEVRFMPAPPAVTHQHVMEFDVEEDDSSRSPSPQEILLEVELDENEVKEFERQVKIITIPEYTADNKSMIISLDVLPSIYEEGAVDFVTQEHDDLKIAFEVTEMPPRFINPICDMETPEGTTVMFECSLMGIPSPIVSWFKGDKKIPHNNKKYLHSSDGDNHFLKIFKVTTQDSGVYTCRAINVVGETLCRASLVVVNAKAFSGKTRGRELTAVSLGSAKVQPQKFDLVVGNTSFDSEQVSEIELEFEFEQEADESQRAVRLVAKTDNEMSEQGEKYVSVNFDVFAEPAKDDKIEFKGKSSDMCSFQFQVTETSPKCVIPLTNVTAAVGTPVILQCLISGKPNPTAEWFKDGDRVTDSRCIIQEKTAGHFNLLITNVTQSDAGEYRCIIQNIAGCIETAALLKVF